MKDLEMIMIPAQNNKTYEKKVFWRPRGIK